MSLICRMRKPRKASGRLSSQMRWSVMPIPVSRESLETVSKAARLRRSDSNRRALRLSQRWLTAAHAGFSTVGNVGRLHILKDEATTTLNALAVRLPVAENAQPGEPNTPTGASQREDGSDGSA